MPTCAARNWPRPSVVFRGVSLDGFWKLSPESVLKNNSVSLNGNSIIFPGESKVRTEKRLPMRDVDRRVNK